MTEEGIGERVVAEEKWHLGKEIPLSLLIVLAVQTGGGIWWAANLSAKLDNAISVIGKFDSERYTKEDARRDRELLTLSLQLLQNQDKNLESRIVSIEQQHNDIRAKIK